MMAEAMRTIINNLNVARDACAAKNFEMMLQFNLKNLKILDVLREELLGTEEAFADPEAAPVAKHLSNVYKDIILRLTNILQSKAPEDDFTKMIEQVTALYRAWLPPEEFKEDNAPSGAVQG